jgi:dTDP-L-rhamnose 4-epimerase
VNPQNQYELSKHSEEAIAINLGRRYEIPSVALRYSIVQGPRQSFYNAYSGAMRIFALNLYFNRAPVIFEDGAQLRDYVNIQDVVSANLLALDDERTDFQVFNVGSGRAYSVCEFYEAMQNIVGKRIDVRMGHHYRFGDTRHIVSDISKLRSLGWEPKFSIDKSIADYWDYLNSQTDIENILDYADKNMAQLNVVRTAQ